jgi:hypothetical protein
MVTNTSARRRISIVFGAGVVAVAGLLVVTSGKGVFRGVATVVVIAFIVGSVVLSLAERRVAGHVADDCRHLVTRYCDFVVAHGNGDRGLLMSVVNWHQKVHIRPNGDVREVVVIEGVAQRDAVYFIRFQLGSAWDQPEKYRKNVAVIADHIEIDGRPTTRWSITNSWLSDARLMSIVHFHSPVRMGQDIRMEMTRFWPGKCLPLMRGGAAEHFVFRTTELLHIQRLEYQVSLPAGFDAAWTPIGFAPPDRRVSVTAYDDVAGRRVFICRATELPGRRTVGMRLALT